MNYIRINSDETKFVLLNFFQTADILTKTFIKSNTIQHNRIKQVYEQISIQIYKKGKDKEVKIEREI